ncbi:MAG: metal ABC transporter ATP-binding protein [Phycisphaeraceae bacterium]|nr:metal ABC transporter ATP-binding protein [Phycisphaeraceae bacterium]
MTQPAVEYEQVGFRYPGQRAPALEGVSLAIESGERLGILGPNGGGKSTLVKITLGLLAGYSGRVRVLGRSPEQARREGLIGYVPQRHDAELGFPLSARDMVTHAAAWRIPAWKRVSSTTRSRVDRMLSLVGAQAYADSPVGDLSGGQLQRAMIARALVGHGDQSPAILALDEPTVGIDAAGQVQFAELLAGLHAELGVTILIVSHDLRAIVAGCDRVACLARRLHSHVSPRGLTPQVLGELFSHDVVGVLSDVHVHAHAASECPHEHEHPHVHAPTAPPLTQARITRADD